MSSTPSRALVVIDVQNEYVTGNLRIEYPPVQQSLGNIARAMDAAHAVGISIVVVQNRAAPTAPLFAHGSDGWQLYPEVASRRRDHWVEKTLPSALAETGIEAWARARGVNTLTLIGYMTHNCVASTAVEALHRGFAVEYLHDASGSPSYLNSAGFASGEQLHKTYAVVFQSRFAAVVSTNDWITAIRTGAILPRSTIHASHQAALNHLHAIST
ncbi:MAG: cysteine hydrolase [Desulfovibrionaceae bacterium]|jgi:nicotinamidase-related amidase|nr:cysteine hydrolase [Desulfovibrionaceae bacterium]